MNDPNALDDVAKVLLLVVVPPKVDARAAGENAGPNIITKANTLPINIRCGVRLDKVRVSDEKKARVGMHRDRRGREGDRSMRVEVSRVVEDD